MVQMMKPSSNPPRIVAVDAPSGWRVEKGDESGLVLVTETCMCHTYTACLPQKVALKQHVSRMWKQKLLWLLTSGNLRLILAELS